MAIEPKGEGVVLLSAGRQVSRDKVLSLDVGTGLALGLSEEHGYDERMTTNRSVTKQDSQVSDKRVRLKGGPNAILDAAENLIRAGGMERLTIGGVAAAVAVTKAGVLHHFPNRRALIRALIERDHSRFAERHDENLKLLGEQNHSGRHDREFAAYAASVLDDAESADSLRLSLTLCCVIDPTLIEGMDVAQTTPWEALDPADDDDVAYAVRRLACEGLWLNAILKIGLPKALKDRILEKLLQGEAKL